MNNNLKSSQELRESLQNCDLFTFNNLVIVHKNVIIKLAKNDARFRQVLKVKLESLKQNCCLKAYYLSMEI